MFEIAPSPIIPTLMLLKLLVTPISRQAAAVIRHPTVFRLKAEATHAES